MNSESANPNPAIQNPKSSMPTFPKYYGELPPVLNPLNLRHYFLLAYWVYFRPTALKVYLYQADPELYCTGTGLGIFRTLRVLAYRNLYMMLPGIAFSFSVLVGLPIVLGASWLQGTPIDWLGWAVGVAGSVVVGVAGGVAVGVAFGLGFGVAFGVVVGVAFGLGFGVVVGVVGGVAVGVVVGVARGVAFDVAFGLGFGAAVGVAFSVAVGMAGSVVVGVAGGVAVGVATSVAVGVAFGVGALRGVFYLLQLLPAWRGGCRGKKGRHPMTWDELGVLPLPAAQQLLEHSLRQDVFDGFRLLAQVTRNPSQRWIAQRALVMYLHNYVHPVRFLYKLLQAEALHTYIFAPVTSDDWKRLPTVLRVLLGELDQRWVDCSSDFFNRFAERLIWWLTLFLRDRRVTPLTHFAGMLYALLNEEAVNAPDFDLATYTPIYTALTSYPGGAEIADTFSAMAAFLHYGTVLDLAQASALQKGLGRENEAVRPSVLTALERLAYVGAEVAAYRDATSRVNRLAALARAVEALETLDAFAAAEVDAPEQALLRRIVRQWRRLVSEAGGMVGRATVSGPVVNPYVVGNPVTGALFVGREDILRRLEELWGGLGVRPSVILYGHRRMGKSSILHNIGARFGAETRVVDFNMQRVGMVNTTGELLYNLALALHSALRDRAALTEPEEAAFNAHNPYTAFDQFLKQADAARGALRFIVTVDEFELLEKRIAEGQVEARLLDYWRGLIHTYPWFVLAFAGLHTLEEMHQDYWHPLFGSVVSISISFLDAAATRRLLTDPGGDFPLDYDLDALEAIATLTRGQPYLVQLIGHALVTRYNRQTYEACVIREARFTLADVTAVLTSSEFYREGVAYFTGVWRQAAQGAPGQQAVLRALAESAAGLSLDVLAQQTGLPPETVKAALATLRAHDVVTQTGDGWQFSVELMRRWVTQEVG